MIRVDPAHKGKLGASITLEAGQAAARLALEAAQHAVQKGPSGARKSRPRSAQLKLAGIATDQTELALPADDHPNPQNPQNPRHPGSNPV